MKKDNAIFTMALIAAISFAVWQGSIFAGTFVFGLASVYIFQDGWE